MNDLLLLIAFIEVQTLDGRTAAINSDQITSMQSARDGEGNKLLVEGVHCAIGMSNGKFISTKESCDSILRKIEQ